MHNNGMNSFTANLIMADDMFAGAAREFVNDTEFPLAWDNLDMKRLSDSYNRFTDSIKQYNTIHRMERRLWSLKIGKGKLPHDLETRFKKQVPAAIRSYSDASDAMEDCLINLDEAGFGPVLKRHLHKFSGLMFEKENAFSEVVRKHYAEMGCSARMIEEFDDAYPGVGHDPIASIGKGKFSNMRDVMKESTNAQIEILKYTEKHGFDYIQGNCTPKLPAWVGIAQTVLKFFGISMSAWTIFVSITVVIALLVVLCATDSLPSSILSYCKYLAVTLGFIF